MYYSAIESHAAAKSKHNKTLRENAKERLKKISWMATHKRKECAPNRKAGKILAARIADWENTCKTVKVSTGYNKPGSMNRF